jgi:hypothetical protein
MCEGPAHGPPSRGSSGQPFLQQNHSQISLLLMVLHLCQNINLIFYPFSSLNDEEKED